MNWAEAQRWEVVKLDVQENEFLDLNLLSETYVLGTKPGITASDLPNIPWGQRSDCRFILFGIIFQKTPWTWGSSNPAPKGRVTTISNVWLARGQRIIISHIHIEHFNFPFSSYDGLQIMEIESGCESFVTNSMHFNKYWTGFISPRSIALSFTQFELKLSTRSTYFLLTKAVQLPFLLLSSLYLQKAPNRALVQNLWAMFQIVSQLNNHFKQKWKHSFLDM